MPGCHFDLIGVPSSMKEEVLDAVFYDIYNTLTYPTNIVCTPSQKENPTADGLHNVATKIAFHGETIQPELESGMSIFTINYSSDEAYMKASNVPAHKISVIADLLPPPNIVFFMSRPSTRTYARLQRVMQQQCWRAPKVIEIGIEGRTLEDITSEIVKISNAVIESHK